MGTLIMRTRPRQTPASWRWRTSPLVSSSPWRPNTPSGTARGRPPPSVQTPWSSSLSRSLKFLIHSPAIFSIYNWVVQILPYRDKFLMFTMIYSPSWDVWSKLSWLAWCSLSCLDPSWGRRQLSSAPRRSSRSGTRNSLSSSGLATSEMTILSSELRSYFLTSLFFCHIFICGSISSSWSVSDVRFASLRLVGNSLRFLKRFYTVISLRSGSCSRSPPRYYGGTRRLRARCPRRWPASRCRQTPPRSPVYSSSGPWRSCTSLTRSLRSMTCRLMIWAKKNSSWSSLWRGLLRPAVWHSKPGKFNCTNIFRIFFL